MEVMETLSPTKPSEMDSVNMSDDDNSVGATEEFLRQSQNEFHEEFSRGKIYNTEANTNTMDTMLERLSVCSSNNEFDEELHQLNIALSNGDEDFDFRTLSREELLDMIRGEPSKESYSNIAKVTRLLQSSAGQRKPRENEPNSSVVKNDKVCCPYVKFLFNCGN